MEFYHEITAGGKTLAGIYVVKHENGKYWLYDMTTTEYLGERNGEGVRSYFREWEKHYKKFVEALEGAGVSVRIGDRIVL